jgi:hypothetical protein
MAAIWWLISPSPTLTSLLFIYNYSYFLPRHIRQLAWELSPDVVLQPLGHLTSPFHTQASLSFILFIYLYFLSRHAHTGRCAATTSSLTLPSPTLTSLFYFIYNYSYFFSRHIKQLAWELAHGGVWQPPRHWLHPPLPVYQYWPPYFVKQLTRELAHAVIWSLTSSYRKPISLLLICNYS